MADLTTTLAGPDFKAESPSVYIPMDRRHALAEGRDLPDRTWGTALLADISGFTPLTEALAHEMGQRRGSEEITRLLGCVYDAILSELHRYGGSAISFGGDAITCWFDSDQALTATAAGLAMQQAMQPFASFGLAIKVAVTAGPARRLVVGEPRHLVLDALAGATIDTLACVEKHVLAGEVVLDEATASTLSDKLAIGLWREDPETGVQYAVVTGLTVPVSLAPWSPLAEMELGEDLVRTWLLPAVYERLRNGQGEFLAELRPVAALFVSFTGIDYDADEDAGAKLDTFIRQVQTILAEHDGTLLQVMFGDKGSTLCAAFGAPVAHEDDAQRAADGGAETVPPDPDRWSSFNPSESASARVLHEPAPMAAG